MNKDAEKACKSLQHAAGLAGLNGVLSPEELSGQLAKLQGEIDAGKAKVKEIITENSETRKMIDDREKAEKVMHSKESHAEKAEKKSDEKAPQYRDEANKASEDFKNLDSALMERLRHWNQTKGDVFNACYQHMVAALTAPSAVGGGGYSASVSVTPVAAAPKVRRSRLFWLLDKFSSFFLVVSSTVYRRRRRSCYSTGRVDADFCACGSEHM